MFTEKRDFGMVGKIFGIPRRWLTRIGSFCTSLTVSHPILTIKKPDFPEPVGNPVEIGIDEKALAAFVAAENGNFVTVDSVQSVSGAKTFTVAVKVETSSGSSEVNGGSIQLSRSDGMPFISFFNSLSSALSIGYIQLTASGTMVVGSRNGGSGVMLSANANEARLANAPTVTQSNTTSKAIATCGWCNSQLAQIDHTHGDAYASKTHGHGNITSSGGIADAPNRFVITDAHGNIIAASSYMSPVMITAIQQCGYFVTDTNAPSGKILKNLYLCQDFENKTKNGILLRGGNDASIELYPTGASHGGYIDFHLAGAETDYTSRIGEGTVTGSGAGLHAISTVAVWLNAPANEAKLANAPTTTPANATDSKAIATLGWVVENFIQANGHSANKFLMTDSDGKITTSTDNVIAVGASDAPYTGTKNVVTGVTWNGTQIVVASETWTYKNGVLVSATANQNGVINTVTYNP